jgi:N6-adenosine-specific RNA methylase IME4
LVTNQGPASGWLPWFLKTKDKKMKYNVIYADPPWSYENKKTGGTMDSSAEDKYNTMSLTDILEMPIRQISDKNAVLFLWATVPLMPEAFQVMQDWGFKYKTMLTWRKVMSMGMGYWFRGQTEHLLFGVKGQVKAFRYQHANFYQCKAGKHSQKPHYFRELISKAVVNSFEQPKKLELFARSREGLFPNDEYQGWHVYGNQVDNSIQLMEKPETLQ